MNKRLITKKEEQAYRLVSHDFEGLSRESAAKIMGITPQALSNLLRNVKRKAPSLFPILTLRQRVVYDNLYESRSREEIAVRTGITLKQVDNIIQQLHKKGFDITEPRKVVQYENWMDNQIKEKF